jgi:hypothetical protein
VNAPCPEPGALHLLGELPREEGLTLLHLLTCPECRGEAAERLAEFAAASGAPDYGPVWDRVAARLE